MEAGSSEIAVVVDEQTKKQVDLLAEINGADIPVRVSGGYAEEAVLSGEVTRKHHDLDYIGLRTDQTKTEEDFQKLGWQVDRVAEEGQEKPYKLLVKKDGVEGDVLLLEFDQERNQPFAESKKPDGTKVRVYFDPQGLNYSPQKLGGVEVKPISPLMQMQMRQAFSLVRNGIPRPQDIEMQEQLRQKYYSGEDPNSEIFKPDIVSYYNLTIPKLKIDSAVVSIGGEDLSQSLIQYPGTALPGKNGNAVIFGHSVLPQFYDPKDYLTIFSTLPTLQTGDALSVNYDGVTYNYKVDSKVEVLPTDLQVLEQNLSDSFLTLVTCVPPGHPLMPRRLIVRARLIPFGNQTGSL